MSKQVSVQYRYLKTDGLPAAFDLKRAIVSCLQLPVEGSPAGTQARLRKISLDQDGSFVVLNKVTAPADWGQPFFAGQLIHLHPGIDVPGYRGTLEEDVNEFVLENLRFEDQLQLAKGILYFGAIGNHVGLIEGAAARGKTLERYLTAFFHRADQINEAAQIVLPRMIPRTEGNQMSEIRSVKIGLGGPALDEAVPVEEREVIRERAAAQEVERDPDLVRRLLQVIGASEEEVRGLERQVPEGGWLQAVLNVSVLNRTKRKQPIPRQYVEEVLRNVPDEEVELFGSGRERAGMVGLKMSHRVGITGGLIEPEDAMTAIQTSLREWSQEGTIDCDFR